MGFHGYNPRDFVQQDKFGIGAASQVLGGAIASIPAQKREEEKLKLKKIGKTWKRL